MLKRKKVDGKKVTSVSFVTICRDNADKGPGYYVDFVYDIPDDIFTLNDVENVSFHLSLKRALRSAHKIASRYHVTCCGLIV